MIIDGIATYLNSVPKVRKSEPKQKKELKVEATEAVYKAKRFDSNEESNENSSQFDVYG